MYSYGDRPVPKLHPDANAAQENRYYRGQADWVEVS